MNDVDWSRLRSFQARALVAVLRRDGFVLRSRSGSHMRFQNPDGRRVTVTYHRPGDTFRPKTLRSIVRDQARWDGADLRRLGLLP